MSIDVEDAPYVVVEKVVVHTALSFPLRGVLQLNRPLHYRFRYFASANVVRDSLCVTQFPEVARLRSGPFADDQDSRPRIPERTATPKAVTPWHPDPRIESGRRPGSQRESPRTC